MNRRAFLATSVGATVSALASSPRSARPNIVFLLADDLGWRDFGAYGNTHYETPEVDRLAREGVRFTDAYAACPVCSPTSASILTGQYPARLHLTDWIPGRKQWPAARLLTPQFEQQLALKEITIAEALKPLGYRTASIGKWHLGGKGFGPENQGFDVNIGGDARGGVGNYFGPFPMRGLERATKDDYLTEQLTEAAERFIEESARANQPFFLYLPHYAVHLPLSVREQDAEKYRRKFGKDKAFPVPEYAALMESFDQSLGRIRRRLDSLGIAGNTIIIVNSDNGGLRYEGASKKLITDNAPLRAGKGHCYEGGIRDPLIIYWPEVTRPGTVNDAVVSSIDFFPTMLEMAGGRGTRDIDGRSLVPLLKGGKPPEREAIFWHYPHYSNQGGVPSGAVRSGDWKLIEFYEDGRIELYNLRRDLGETTNLASREPKRAAKLREMLRRWRNRVGAAMPTPNSGWDPAKADQGLTGAEPPTPASD